jgi:hypothetical protein
MKTTIDIADPLLEEAKAVASRSGTTVRALVEEGLRHAIKARRRRRTFKLRSASFGGNGLRPEVADGSWERIREAAYEGHGG